MSDTRIATNIYRTSTGFRVYVNEIDERTGRAHKVGKRFKGFDWTLDQLEAYRDARVEAGRDPDRLEGFAADATRYLELEDIQAMPSYTDRVRQIKTWIGIFGMMPREAIDKNAINDALHRLHKQGYSGPTVNKFRNALMSLWTTLDGRSAANPVKDAVAFPEGDLIPRGQSYELLTMILDAIPDERGLAIDRPTLYRELWTESATTVATQYGVSSSFLKRLCTRLDIPTPPRGYWAMPLERRPLRPPLRRGITGQSPELLKSRARLEVLFSTGMDPGQLGRMELERDFSFAGPGWYTPPRRRKGRDNRRRTPRPMHRLPMTDDSRAAFRRLVEVDGLGSFCARSLLKTWLRACRRVERKLRTDYKDPTFRIPHIRLKDLRHSFGTKLWEDTGGDAGTVGKMLTLAPGSPMIIRYSLGAIDAVLRTQMQKFKTGRKHAGGTVTGRARGSKTVPFPRNA